MTKINLLFVTWSLTSGGGEAKSTISIINGLSNEKYKITIFELIHGLEQIEFNKDINFINPIVNYEHGDMTLQREQMIFNEYNREINKFIKAINLPKYDCIIACNVGLATYVASKLDSSIKVALVMSSLNNIDNVFQNEDIKDLKKIYNKFNKITCISQTAYFFFNYNLSELNNKVILLESDIDFEKIMLLAEQDEDITIPDEHILINVGRLKEVKNQYMLLLVANELKKIRDDFVIYIIGEGPLEDILRSSIREFDLGDYVKLIRNSDNPYPIIKNAKLFCSTSKTEATSPQLYESVALGIPFISTNVEGAKELLQHGNKCGVIVDNSYKEYAYTIDQLLDHSGLYYELQEGCLEETKRFVYRNLSVKLDEVIDEALNYIM